eukprot:s1374_g17.t1
MLSVCNEFDQFDMSCTDIDISWTISPDLTLLGSCDAENSVCSCICRHIRVVSNVGLDQLAMPCDVILDSGADTSALALHFSEVGTACPDPNTTYVDAQGSPWTIESTRLAIVQFGNVQFREKFIIADITTPLLALGHIIKAGWNLVQKPDGPCLEKDGHCISVLYRIHSLCARGSISMVREVEPEDAIQAIRAAPVDTGDGGPLAEDRVVLGGPDEAIALLAAHGAEVRLKAEAEREVRGQKIPKPPTQAEIDSHNLTHEPFKDWCELCTMYRARQDKHVASDHDKTGHSVLSFDFGYCSRMSEESDKLTCLVLKTGTPNLSM